MLIANQESERSSKAPSRCDQQRDLRHADRDGEIPTEHGMSARDRLARQRIEAGVISRRPPGTVPSSSAPNEIAANVPTSPAPIFMP
jgi:hypothetical protein